MFGVCRWDAMRLPVCVSASVQIGMCPVRPRNASTETAVDMLLNRRSVTDSGDLAYSRGGMRERPGHGYTCAVTQAIEAEVYGGHRKITVADA